MELHLKIIGCALICLGLVHSIFPQKFNWKQELKSLTVINREMMYIHTLFIAITLLLVGFLCLTSSAELITTPLGKRISLGLGIFWALRFLVQFFGYSSVTWKGKQFETIIHIGFALFWAYLSAVFIIIYLRPVISL
jgi:hypothetical protein